jgi:ABC-type antimicrobial peptide transport system permease subunit
MDVKREGVGKRKAIRRVVYLTLTLVAVVLIGWRVSLMKPAVPVVEAATCAGWARWSPKTSCGFKPNSTAR